MKEHPQRKEVRSRLMAGAEHMRIPLAPLQADRLISFLFLLQHWNNSYNLTAVREPLEMVSRHLLDSLSVLPYLFGGRVLDVGSGPGLPGIPLAIAAPERAFYLLDSNGKKARFMRQAVLEIGLKNITVAQARMEAYLPAAKFATIIARAVASGPVLVSATARLLAHPARVLIMKGQRPTSKELDGLEPTPDILCVHRLQVPFLAAQRHLIDARYEGT